MNKYDFFISHSSSIKEIARVIYFNSKINNINPWYDESLLETGDLLSETLKRGINDSSGFLLFYSQSASFSKFVKSEMRWAKRKKLIGTPYSESVFYEM